MKLNDLLTKTLSDVLKETNIISVKPISDDSGEVIKITIEYEPKNITKSRF